MKKKIGKFENGGKKPDRDSEKLKKPEDKKVVSFIVQKLSMTMVVN